MVYDVWYTLLWAFGRFFDLPQPLRYITKIEVFSPPSVNPSKIRPSRLDTLTMAQSDSIPSIGSMPGVVQLDRIKTLHLSFHDWPTTLNLFGLRHVSLTNSLGALKSFASLPSGIRSIQLLVYANMPDFISTDRSVFRSLSSLPMLRSLHIVLNDMATYLDQLTCEILAESVPMLATFAIYFRSQTGISTPESSDHSIPFLWSCSASPSLESSRRGHWKWRWHLLGLGLQWVSSVDRRTTPSYLAITLGHRTSDRDWRRRMWADCLVMTWNKKDLV